MATAAVVAESEGAPGPAVAEEQGSAALAEGSAAAESVAADDALLLVTGDGAVAVRAAEPAEMFGQQSRPGMPQAVAEVVAESPRPMEAERGVQFEALLLFALYTAMVLIYRREIGALFAGLFTSLHKQFAERTYIFDKFITLASWTGLAAAGCAAVRCAALLLPEGAGVPWGVVVAGAVAVMAVIAAVQCAIISFAGMAVLQRSWAGELIFIKKIYASVLAVTVAPVVFVWFPVAAEESGLFLYIVGIEVVVVLLLFLVQTFRLFVAQKISIFYWILYLCAVEILPFSIIAKLVAENS